MTAQSEATPPAGATRVHTLLGWLTVAANLAFTGWSYYGYAPPPEGMPTDWWHGRTFILDWESMGAYVDAPLTGAALWTIPAAVICIATFFTTRSAIARLLSLTCAITCFFYAAAGFAAGTVWMLFSWRLTAVMELTALALAATSTSALLAERWLKLGWGPRLFVYVPLFFIIMAAVRGATGTNEALSFGVSPWPILTTFGLDNVVFVLCGLLFATAIGVLALSRDRLDQVARAGLVIAVVLPGLWIQLRLPGLHPWTLFAVTLAVVVMVGAASFFRASDSEGGLVGRGFRIALGAALVFVPILSGSALAKGDFAVNRYVLSPVVIEALQAHIKAEEFYPEKLEDLVEGGYVDEAPKPHVGFDVLEQLGLADPVAYRYNEYGSSFVLEFDSSLWVQCQYSGNYYFDDEEEEVYEDDEDWEEEESEWSCLDKRPALMGDDSVEEEGSDDEYQDEYDDAEQ
ncbi:MAG: hypothetical protein GY944_02885 [bacterium]|nr:hypothetical protein [bacterium]